MTDRVKRDRSSWGGLTVLLGDFLLTASALTGFFLAFLTLYSDGERPMGPLDLFCLEHSSGSLAGAALGLALAAVVLWSLPRFRRPAAALFAGGWAGYVLLLREDFGRGAQLTAKVIADLFEDRVGWFGPLRLSFTLDHTQELLALERFLFPALLLLSFLLGWAVVRCRRWWVAVLLTLPPLLPGLLADVYPSWPAFLLLCLCWCTMLLTSLCKWSAPSGRGRLTLAALPLVGGVLVCISLLFPLEGYQRPQWTYAAEDALVDFGNRHLSFLSGLEGPFTNRVTYVGSAETVNLDSAGPLNFSGRRVLKVTSEDYTGTVYLRGASLARYEDNRWEAMEDSAYRQYSSRLSGADSPSPLTFPSLTSAGGKAYTLTVENTGASGACAYAPYHLTHQDWAAAGVQPVDDACLAREEGQWSHTFAFIPDLAPGSGVNSNLEAKTAYTDFAYAGYLDLPDGLRHTLLTLMDERFEGLSPLDAANAVAQYLADTCRYDPDTPAVPDGEDFVTYFLTESHRGYCMHFASAAALMLRALGIPARYVSGFTADVTAGKTTYVPDSASHAWVEVYVEGYGWQPVEVTPGYVEEEDLSEPPSAVPSEGPSDTPELPSHSPDVSHSPEPSLSPSLSPNAGQPGNQAPPRQPSALTALLGRLVQVLKWVVLGAGACALLWLGQYLPKKLRAKRLTDPDTNRAVLYGYRCLNRLKKWGGTLPDAVLELAQKARFSQHTLSEEERAAVVACFNGQRRQLSATLSPIKKMAFRYLWGWPASTEEEEHDHP